MIEIVMFLGAALALLMHSGRQQVSHHVYNHSLGTLGDKLAQTANGGVDATRFQGVKIKQMKACCTLTNFPNAEGPIVVGFAIGSNAVEIGEAMIADPQAMDDVPAVEQANRKVFPIWVFGPAQDENQFQGPVGGRGGPNMLEEINLPWKEIPEEINLNSFVWNSGEGGGALSGDASVIIMTTMVTEWLRD